MYDHIIEILRRGDAAAGLKEARAAVAATPDEQPAQRLLARAEALAGTPGDAHRSLDHALELTPQDASLHYLRAALLVAEGRGAEAAAPLGQTVAMDPNDIRAYLLQMQLAIARGDLDDADRLGKLASRLDPEHPRLLVQQALVALHRNDAPRAHALLHRAAPRAPGDIQLRYVTGLAYRAQGHYAFAEQAFRDLIEKNPSAFELRFLLADTIRLQQRHAEAAELLEAGITGDTPPDVLRYAGELHLAADDHARALPLLQRAAAGQPGDRPTQDALLEALRRQDDPIRAREILEPLLAASPKQELLWAARLHHEPASGDRRGVQARWQAAMPHSIHAMHAGMDFAAEAGETEEANTLARRILEEHPGHMDAQVYTIRNLYRTDPAAAVRHIRDLLPRVQDPRSLRMVRGWLARAQDKAGDYAGALATWLETRRIGEWPPLPPAPVQPLPPGRAYPPLAPTDADPRAPRPMFAWGPPGSGIEMVVGVLAGNMPTVRNDRLAIGLPADPFAQAATATGLADGSRDPVATIAAWRRLLPMRQIEGDHIVDWMPHWENAWLHALRGELPEGLLLLALRDPRDMLMDWLANGGHLEYAVESPLAMAQWLLPRLEQMADLIEGGLYPHRIVRMDGLGEDAEALTRAVADALGTELAGAQVHGPARLPAGHWRVYRDALGDAFAVLAPVAVRLGYAAD
jgi:tetratricopeptide (TPR) repeat protein